MEKTIGSQSEKVLISKCVNIDKLLEINLELIRSTKSRIEQIDSFEPPKEAESDKSKQPEIVTLVQHLNWISHRIDCNNNELSNCYDHLQNYI